MRTRATAVAVMLLALAGCAAPRSAAQDAAGNPTTPPTPSAASGPAASSRPTPEQVVHDTRSTLYGVDVRQVRGDYSVSAWWALERGGRTYGAIVTSTDGFASAHYERGGWAAWARHRPIPRKAPPPALDALDGLAVAPSTSLAPAIRAFVAGGDGATLLPFERVARSTSGGDWRVFVVPRTHGDQAYDEGDLVLPDGRLLVLLGAWSSDRGPTRPGPEHHGLWISAADDWATYTPHRPPFSPALRPSDAVASIQARSGAAALVVATTRHNDVYVSTDGARTFDRIRAR